MVADPLPFVRRFALLTALVVIVGGIVLSLRRSPAAGALYLVAGALLLLAVAWPMIADRLGSRGRRSGTPFVLGLLGLAFLAFVGGTLLLPRAGASDGSENEPAVVGLPAAREAPPTQAAGGGIAPAPADSPVSPATGAVEAAVTPPIPATARPVSVPTGVPLVGPTSPPGPPTSVPPTPTPGRDDYLVRIDAAWAADDWVAVEAAAVEALARYPGAPEFQDKLVAARVNRGDELTAAGRPAEAAAAYASAREVRADPVVDQRLAALTPTPTPAPRRTVAFSGVCEPSGLYVGEWFVAQFGILNTGDAPIEGLRIRASGPWERFSVARADPPGVTRLEGSIGEPELVTTVTIPPGNEFYVQLVAYAEQVGIYQFTFRPILLNGEPLVNQAGGVPTVVCAVAVGEP